jgi:hypothetical protein
MISERPAGIIGMREGSTGSRETDGGHGTVRDVVEA